MMTGGITEMVAHFVGYLHIALEDVKQRVSYEDGALRLPSDGYSSELPEYDASSDVAEFSSRASPAPTPIVYPMSGNSSPRPPLEEDEARGPHEPRDPRFIPELPPAPDPGPMGGGIGGNGGSLPLLVSLHYGEGGDQLQFEARQNNVTADDDILLTRAEDAAFIPDPAAISAALGTIAADGQAAIPETLHVPQSGGDALVQFVVGRDQETAARIGNGEGEGAGDPNAVAPGYYVDGVATTPPETPEVQAEEVVVDLGTEPGQWAVTGSNEAVNAALIVDYGESSRTMVVMGDYFKSNIIIQANAYADEDNIVAPAGVVETGANTVENKAQFDAQPGVYAGAPDVIDGVSWNIDVVSGDFYDIQMLTQQNYLSDNDAIVQDSLDVHYELYSGDNGLYNLAELTGLSLQQYDVIIVLGDMHSANIIYQSNILYDNDSISATGGEEDETAGASSGGQNELTNNAVIVTYGEDTFLPVSYDMSAFVGGLGAQPGLYAPSDQLLLELNGNGQGTLNILYITGDYYDINYIYQTNVVADSDALAQQGDSDEFASASTGSNLLMNDAAIVDVGATTVYVAGDAYSDSILVQAELVEEQGDGVVFGDVNTLVPELVAFTDMDNGNEEQEAAAPSVASHADDMLGNVMT